MTLPWKILGWITAALVTIAAGAIGYRLVRADLTAHVYKQRLATLSKDYEHLRATYNEAIKRAAVSELVVEKGKLSVRVRTQDGAERVIDTPYDPKGEIYVDYAVIDQRLWIRRVFDAKTPPEKGLLIEPELASVDWNGPNASHGKAVYRTLSEGRWVISVSGDGALGLTRLDGPSPSLAGAPEIKDYSEIEAEAARQAEAIGASEVWEWMFGGGRP
ncbi:MAG: hypothetical protein U0638_07600 [Phycisphaerales bacterium]